MALRVCACVRACIDPRPVYEFGSDAPVALRDLVIAPARRTVDMVPFKI